MGSDVPHFSGVLSRAFCRRGGELPDIGNTGRSDGNTARLILNSGARERLICAHNARLLNANGLCQIDGSGPQISAAGADNGGWLERRWMSTWINGLVSGPAGNRVRV
jgi:hypothetical protein